MLRDEATGELLFNAANILNLYFRRSFMEKIADDPSLMDYHIAKKKIPYVNDEGQRTTPAAPNGWKFEKFVLDCTPHANNSVAVMFVKREDEFAPIKNGWDSSVDSPVSARLLLADFWKRKVEALGGTVVAGEDDASNSICEVSPLLSDEQLAALVKGKQFVAPCYIK